jgi:cell division protease FtsH
VFLGRDYNTDKTFSDQVALEIDNEVRKIINDCYDRAKTVLTENIELLKLIAQYLLEVETLTKEDIYEIVDKGSLGWWEKKKAKQALGVPTEETTDTDEDDDDESASTDTIVTP